MVTLKGTARDANGVGGFVRVKGQFAVASNAITAASVRPKRTGYTVTRKAAGVYEINFTQAFLAVEDSKADVGLAASFVGSALPTAPPVRASCSKDFMTSDGTNVTADTTKHKVLILCFNAAGNALADVPANYALSFSVSLSDSVNN